MAEAEGQTTAERSSSLLHNLKRFVAAASAALHTRLELFLNELEEERERLKQTLLLALLLFFGLSFGFILLNIFLVAVFWEKGWVVALGALAAVYLGIGIVAAVLLRRRILTRPHLFPATLAELGKDRDRLRASWHE